MTDRYELCWLCYILPKAFQTLGMLSSGFHVQALKPEYADAAAELTEAGIPVTLAKVSISVPCLNLPLLAGKSRTTQHASAAGPFRGSFHGLPAQRSPESPNSPSVTPGTSSYVMLCTYPAAHVPAVVRIAAPNAVKYRWMPLCTACLLQSMK